MVLVMLTTLNTYEVFSVRKIIMMKSNLDEVYEADHHSTLLSFLYQLRVTVINLSVVMYLQK